MNFTFSFNDVFSNVSAAVTIFHIEQGYKDETSYQEYIKKNNELELKSEYTTNLKGAAVILSNEFEQKLVNKFSKIAAWLCAVMLLGARFAISSRSDGVIPTASAAEPSYKMSDEYKAGRFYKNFTSVKLTGDERKDVIEENKDQKIIFLLLSSFKAKYVNIKVDISKIDCGAVSAFLYTN